MASKSMLIMDTPECCGDCPLRYRTEDIPLGGYQYQMTWGCKMVPDGTEDYYIANPQYEKPRWCPLKKVPEKLKPILRQDEYGDGYDAGFNTCVDIILEEKEVEDDTDT